MDVAIDHDLEQVGLQVGKLLCNEQQTILEQYLGNRKPHDRKRWAIIVLLHFLNAWIHKKQLGKKCRSRSIIAWSSNVNVANSKIIDMIVQHLVEQW